MVAAMFSNYAGESSLTASWRACKENELLVVELLMIKVIEVALWTSLLEQRRDCIDFMRFFEDYSVPRLQPSEYVSIVQLIGQQIDESFRLILLDPLLPIHRILIDGNLIHLILLQLSKIPEILHLTLIQHRFLLLLNLRVYGVVHLHFFVGMSVIILRKEESDGLILF